MGARKKTAKCTDSILVQIRLRTRKKNRLRLRARGSGGFEKTFNKGSKTENGHQTNSGGGRATEKKLRIQKHNKRLK